MLMPGRIRRLLAMATAVALVAVACGGSGTGGTTSSASGAAATQAAAQTSSAPIKIGTVLPTTGGSAGTAGQYLNGMKAYIQLANSAGGVNGRKIDYVVTDDGFEVPRTVSGARQLVQRDNVVAILGAYGTTNTIALMPVAEELQVPLIGPLAYSNKFYSPTPKYFYALWPGYQSLLAAQTKFIAGDLGRKKLGLLIRTEAAGDEAIAGIKEAIGSTGAQIVTTVQYTIGTADFAGPVQQVLAANPDGIIVTGASVDVGKAMIALKRAQFAGPIVDTIAAGDPLVVKFGESSADGVYGQSLVDTSGTVAGWQEYADALKAIPDADPKNTYTVSGWVAAKALVTAMRSIKGEITASSVQKALDGLTKVDMGGLTGAISFTPTNHLGLTTVQLTQVKNGVVQPANKTLEVR